MSLSVLKVDDAILNWLDSATQAPAWPVGVAGTIQKPDVTMSTPWCHKMWSWAARGYDWFHLNSKSS